MEDQQGESGQGGGGGTRPRSFRGQQSEPEKGGGDSAELFDHEKLIVYQVGRELFTLVSPWLTRKMSREEHDQLDRSIRSLMSNIGEGAGKFARAEKRRYYEIARGSGSEAATQLDLLRIRGVITLSEYQQARVLLLRVVKMLSRLCSGPRPT